MDAFDVCRRTFYSGERKRQVPLYKCIMNVDLMTSRDFHYDNEAHIDIISASLKDDVCIKTFQNAILHNRHLFRNRIVLNLNCSIGIYALFAAKAGAAKVYAIDNSNVLDYTRRIVYANNYTNIIHIIKGKIQDIALPVRQVDVIICDWMGHALLYQSKCADVIYARDKWLNKSNGIILPDIGKLYIAAVQDEVVKSNSIDWWKYVHGFKMHCIRERALKQPKYTIVQTTKMLAKHCRIKTIDLNTATYKDLNFCSKYLFHIERTGEMDGIALYFRIDFSKCHRPIVFNTDPWSPSTRFLQTVSFFDNYIQVYAEQTYLGRIEFVSPIKYNGTIPNLNNIIIKFDLFTAIQNEYAFITKMRWQLK